MFYLQICLLLSKIQLSLVTFSAHSATFVLLYKRQYKIVCIRSARPWDWCDFFRKANWWCRTRGNRSCRFYIAQWYSFGCWSARSAGSRTRSFITDCRWIPWRSPGISTSISCSSRWSRYRRIASPGCWPITLAVNQRSPARSCWAGCSASQSSSYRQVKR